MGDVLEFIDFRTLQALNVKPDRGAENALKQGPRDDARLFTESDCDEQLLFNIPFTQAVRLTGLSLSGPDPDATGYSADALPKAVRLFVNRPSLGFAEAENDPAAQEIEFGGEGDGGGALGAVIPLKAARFKGVTSLAVAVLANAGDADTTQVGCLKLFGSAGETFDVSAIKKAGEEGGPGGGGA